MKLMYFSSFYGYLGQSRVVLAFDGCDMIINSWIVLEKLSFGAQLILWLLLVFLCCSSPLGSPSIIRTCRLIPAHGTHSPIFWFKWLEIATLGIGAELGIFVWRVKLQH